MSDAPPRTIQPRPVPPRTVPRSRVRSAPELPVVALTGELPADVPVLALPSRPDESAGALALGPAPQGLDLPALLGREEAKGAPGELVALPVVGAGPLERVLVVGTGSGSPDDLRRAAAALTRRVRSATAVALDLRELAPDDAGLRALVEGALLASYGFTLAVRAEPHPLGRVVLVVPDPAAARAAVERARITALATCVARDLVNAPPDEATPAWFTDRASDLLDDLEMHVRDERALAAEGFGGLIGVGQGSARPPRLFEAVYEGGGDTHVVLVGKGITFDSGGLSLKPNDSMQTMKGDMSGAAAVVAVLRAVADLGLPLQVTVLAALAENMPSGSAYRPGDVLRHYGGRTVEVLNTDAEGRLVLADALAYADRVLEPDLVVDVATLTGAMPVALGKRTAGLFASDDALADALLAAAQDAGEALWRMPLVEDYRSALDSPTADLRNIGDPRKKLQGGSITAALFLREFTGGRPWAHLDIAGPFWSGADEDEVPKGGTGYGVRLLVRWLEALAAQRAPASTPA